MACWHIPGIYCEECRPTWLPYPYPHYVQPDVPKVFEAVWPVIDPHTQAIERLKEHLAKLANPSDPRPIFRAHADGALTLWLAIKEPVPETDHEPFIASDS